MNQRNFPSLLVLFLFFLPLTTPLNAQEITLGFHDSIESRVLNETRDLFIKLPKDYYNSDKSYPVLYRLDGDLDLLTETAGLTQRLIYREELVPEMIVVLIKNTQRTRDMMPVNTSFYKGEPGAEKFLRFFQEELFLHMSRSYRTSNEKILCGQSLSSVFTLFTFLTSPGSFDSYIASSAGFPDCEAYFKKLTQKMQNSNPKYPTKLFLSYGAKDHLDPNGVIKQQLSDFTRIIEAEEYIDCRYIIYPEEGHVPYQSLYHGLKFIYE